MPLTKATPNVTTGLLPTTGGSITGPVVITNPIEVKSTPSISSSTLNLDLSQASLFYVSLNSAITTFTLSNPPANPNVFSFVLQFVADGTARAVTWPTGTRWSGGNAPTLTSTLNKVDTFTFLTHDGGSNWFAFISSQNQ